MAKEGFILVDSLLDYDQKNKEGYLQNYRRQFKYYQVNVAIAVGG